MRQLHNTELENVTGGWDGESMREGILGGCIVGGLTAAVLAGPVGAAVAGGVGCAFGTTLGLIYNLLDLIKHPTG
ncbi:hypothetical protein GCM10011385_14380 [Nitratireductor aestuarii]|uniref:Bacteriocin n=1 Tax=Nitratireductor aestuarii TaxID=1735103 RepID=A0A916RPC3_9HYPH|nr:hypothetical protein GCM10011385_14380 [Nitratireductor aestuarii]